MKIKVVAENANRIQEQLHAVNGDAIAHAATVDDVLDLALRAEQALSDRGLPGRGRAGIEVTWQAQGAWAKAYRSAMNRTRVTIVRGGDGFWFLTELGRVKVYPQQREVFRITINEQQRDRIVFDALAPFHVRASGIDQKAAGSDFG